MEINFDKQVDRGGTDSAKGDIPWIFLHRRKLLKY